MTATGSANAQEDVPFEVLGEALLEAADQAAAARPDEANPAGLGDGLLVRLAPLHERVPLGALELWFPRRRVERDGALVECARPGEWKSLALDLAALQVDWYDDLSEPAASDAVREQLRRALRELERGSSQKALAMLAEVAPDLRDRLFGPRLTTHELVLLSAPTRAHYVAVHGAAGILRRGVQPDLWRPFARRSANQRLSDAVLVACLTWSAADDSRLWAREEPMGPDDLRQQTVHAASHLFSSALLPPTPVWFGESLAVRDTVGLVGADETLCAGYRGRAPGAFDGFQQVPAGFLAYSRLERSPFRGTGSRKLFAAQLHKAATREGFRILDLDRGRAVLSTPGPFLGGRAVAPVEVESGPRGLKEGYAEFLRAYGAAFVGWLGSESAENGATLLSGTLRLLRASEPGKASRLEQALFAVSGRTLGRSNDPARDLEAAFQASLRLRR